VGVIVRGVRNLQRFQRALSGAKREMPEMVAKRVGVALMKQVMDEFRESRDPYGKAWAPVFRRRKKDRAARNRRYAKLSAAGKSLSLAADKPLMDTGRLRASTGFAVSGTSVRVFLSADYASYHDKGTRRIKRRQILPSPGNLGAKWSAAVEKEAKRGVSEHFGER
jgi:hypothetical protein